jgi:DNA-binding NarL/FixJ family response regulator
MPIKVAIVEDDTFIRQGVSMLLSGTDGFHCVGAFASAEEAIEKIPACLPDVVLMDIHLPTLSGIDCVLRLKPQIPSIQFIMFTVFEDDEKVFRSLAAGASGYLIKKTPPIKLLEAITDIHHGGSPMSGRIARKVLDEFQRLHQHDADLDALSERENAVLSRLSQGSAYKEIARDLNVSIHTVRSHIRHIYEKLHVRSSVAAVKKFLQHHQTSTPNVGNTHVPESSHNQSTKYEKSGLSPALAAQYAKRLISAMVDQKLYLNSDLTLDRLAERLGISPHHLSQVLNVHCGQNFFDFVNHYRVKAVQQSLLDPQKQRFTVLALGLDAGFSSKATFNLVFKKHTGVSPSDFRKQATFLPPPETP